MIFLTQSPHRCPVYENSPLTDHVPLPWPQKGTRTSDEPCFFCSPDVWMPSSLLLYFLACLYHFYFYKVCQYTTIRRWPQCLYLSMMPGFSAPPWRKPERKSIWPRRNVQNYWNIPYPFRRIWNAAAVPQALKISTISAGHWISRQMTAFSRTAMTGPALHTRSF